MLANCKAQRGVECVICLFYCYKKKGYFDNASVAKMYYNFRFGFILIIRTLQIVTTYIKHTVQARTERHLLR